VRKFKQNRPGFTNPGHNRSCIERAAVAQLKPRPGDPWQCSDRDVEIAISVMQRLPDGAPLPVITNERGEVLIGHIFVKAALRLGLEWLSVLRHEGLTELEEKHYTIAINRLLGKGGWEPAALEGWIREFEVGIDDFDHMMIGFDNGELDRILGIPKDMTGLAGADDEVASIQAIAVSRVGMLWQAGRHLILCGDATNPEHFQRLMATYLAKLVITDPPYGCVVDGFVSKKGQHRNFVQGAGEMSREELEAFFFAFASNLARVLQKGALVYIFIDWRSLDLMLRVCEKVFGSLVQLCCWKKDRAGMGSLYRSQHELVLVFRMPGAKHSNNVMLGRNGRNRSNVWDYPSAASSRSGREGDMLKLHPTPKTVEMISDAILDSTEHGDRVIDCFLGSGTTVIAAERTGRICHGMELDPHHVDASIRRWQTATGLAAVDTATSKTFDELAAEAAEEEGKNDE
jgi:DNA modification methylase